MNNASLLPPAVPLRDKLPLYPAARAPSTYFSTAGDSSLNHLSMLPTPPQLMPSWMQVLWTRCRRQPPPHYRQSLTGGRSTLRLPSRQAGRRPPPRAGSAPRHSRPSGQRRRMAAEHRGAPGCTWTEKEKERERERERERSSRKQKGFAKQPNDNMDDLLLASLRVVRPLTTGFCPDLTRLLFFFFHFFVFH